MCLRLPLPQPEALSDELQGSLVLDGEAVYSLVSNPFLLLLARVVLLSCSPKMEQLQVRSSLPRMQCFTPDPSP